MTPQSEGSRLVQAFRDAGRVARDPKRILRATVALAKSLDPEAMAFVPDDEEGGIVFTALLECEDASSAEAIVRFAQRGGRAARDAAHYCADILSLRGDWRVDKEFQSGTFLERKLALNDTFLLLAADSLVAVGASAVDYLKNLLAHRDPETRALAADIARRIGREAEPVADLLLNVLVAEKADHRLTGAWALAACSPAAAELVVETVLPFLEASYWVTRGQAVTILALVGKAGAPAIPRLRAISEDPLEQEVVKERALAAIRAIEESKSR